MNLLQRLFTTAEGGRKRGLSLAKGLRRRWYGAHWHTAHHVKVRLGPARLRSLYYLWVRKGRRAECLAPRFACMLPPIPAEIVKAFLGACAVAGVSHFSEAFRLIDMKGFSCGRVLSALPDRSRRILREAFAARRQAEIEARKLAKQLQRQTHRLWAGDTARSRRLKKLAELI